MGIQYVTRNKVPLVLDIYPNSPAASSGIAPGDELLAVNGVTATTTSGPFTIRRELYGSEGEPVDLTVRKPDGEMSAVTLVKKLYPTPYVNFRILDNGVGYLKIYSFDPKMAEAFTPIEKRLVTDKVTKLIIDLRNNPGGDVDTVEAFINKFVPTGILFSEKEKNSTAPVIHKAKGDAPLKDIKVALLVNKYTASATEIFASAMRDNKQTVIIGTQTEGKSTEQQFFDFADGSALRLTIGRWFNAKGEWLNGKGLTPDITVDTTSGQDPALSQAIQYLSNPSSPR